MEFIDHHPVVSHRIRFQGRTEITEFDAEHVKDGNTMVWLVRTRCLPPQYHPTAREAEDRYRFNIQAVEAAMPLVGAARDAALVRLNNGQPQLWDPEPQPTDGPEYHEDHAAWERRQAAHDADLAELSAITDLLADLGELHEDERPVNALRRLLERRASPVMGVARVEDPAFAEAASLPYDPASDVEVVGSVYRRDRKSDLQALLEREFD